MPAIVINGAGNCGHSRRVTSSSCSATTRMAAVLTAMEHSATNGMIILGTDERALFNRFNCIPVNLVYRPQQRHPSRS